MSLLSRVVVIAALAMSAPLAAQNTGTLRPMVSPVKVDAVQVDWKAQYDRERAKNQELRGQVTSLQAQLDAWTNKGGSQVHAYCETPTLSRNTAGASNDCAAGGGYKCEDVSGLCRTSAANSSQCATGFTWCVYGNRCVRSADECRQ